MPTIFAGGLTRPTLTPMESTEFCTEEGLMVRMQRHLYGDFTRVQLVGGGVKAVPGKTEEHFEMSMTPMYRSEGHPPIWMTVRVLAPLSGESWRRKVALLAGGFSAAGLPKEVKHQFKDFHLADEQDFDPEDPVRAAQKRMEFWIRDRCDEEIRSYKHYWGMSWIREAHDKYRLNNPEYF